MAGRICGFPMAGRLSGSSSGALLCIGNAWTAYGGYRPYPGCSLWMSTVPLRTSAITKQTPTPVGAASACPANRSGSERQIRSRSEVTFWNLAFTTRFQQRTMARDFSSYLETCGSGPKVRMSHTPATDRLKEPSENTTASLW